MHIIILGPPGSGKGTQADFIIKRYNMQHMSTGELFRGHIEKQTELGKLAKGYMDKGEYVPDEVTISMVKEYLQQNESVLLDGFPRTEPQAQALDAMLKELEHTLTCILFLDVPDEEVIQRIVKRGQAGSGRSDDNEETARKRLRVYYDQTHVLYEHYRDNGRLIHINGFQSIETVTEEIFAHVDPLKNIQ